MTWIKSSFSNGNGGNNCVEVEFQSSSSCASGTCVEVASCCGDVLVRDSKDPQGAVLRFNRDEWTAFIQGVQAGEFP